MLSDPSPAVAAYTQAIAEKSKMITHGTAEKSKRLGKRTGEDMPPITEAKLFEAFGLSPQGTGAQGQAVAEPAAEGNGADPAQGAQGQAVAEPAAQDPAANVGTSSEPGADSAKPDDPADLADKGTDSGKKTLTPEQRHAAAAQRRQREQQNAIDAAVAAAKREQQTEHESVLQELFQASGIKDPETGESITTVEQFRKWQRYRDDQRIQQELKSGKLTKETLEQMISAHPAVRRAEEMISSADSQRQQQAEAEGKARIEADMTAIGEMNPNVKELADILAMPTGTQFREYVLKGHTFLDAYKLANMDAIADEKAQRAVQAAQNAARGKEHLVATGNARGGGAVSVPASQMKLFRQMNPGASDAEIQKFYNRYLSKQGG